MPSNLRTLSDKLWCRLTDDNPDWKLSEKIMDVMIDISKVAELISAQESLDKDREINEKAKCTVKRRISDAILMLLVVAKQMDIDMWNTLEDKAK